jgi:hypothetical protein
MSFLKALYEGDHLALFGLGHLELFQGLGCVPEEYVPITLSDADPAMRKLQISTAVVDRTAGAPAQVVDQELQFTLYTVRASMRPEAAELRIFLKSRRQVRGNRGNRVLTTEPFVERFLADAHIIPLP